MEIKGLVIQSRKEFAEECFGKDAWQKVLDALSPVDREALAQIHG